jgi:hypothetical protein
MKETTRKLFKELIYSKTITIEKVLTENYGEWRQLLAELKMLRANRVTRFSNIHFEKIGISFDLWGSKIKERSAMFKEDEFVKFIESSEVCESLAEDIKEIRDECDCDENMKENDITNGSNGSTDDTGPRSPPIARKSERNERGEEVVVVRGKKAVMIEIDVGNNSDERTPKEERKRSAQQHVRFNSSSPESDSARVIVDDKAYDDDDDDDEEEEEEELLLETPLVAPRRHQQDSLPPPLEALTVVKRRTPSTSKEMTTLSPHQLYDSAERLKIVASEKLSQLEAARNSSFEQEEEEEEDDKKPKISLDEHVLKVLTYLEGFKNLLMQTKNKVAAIKSAPLSLAMAETISVELDLENSIKEIQAEIERVVL